jgi:hypothetical protein
MICTPSSAPTRVFQTLYARLKDIQSGTCNQCVPRSLHTIGMAIVISLPSSDWSDLRHILEAMHVEPSIVPHLFSTSSLAIGINAIVVFGHRQQRQLSILRYTDQHQQRVSILFTVDTLNKFTNSIAIHTTNDTILSHGRSSGCCVDSIDD